MEVDTSDDTAAEPPPPLSSEELSMQRREKLLERKQTIAYLASGVMQNPEENVSTIALLLKATSMKFCISVTVQ